MIEVDGPAQRHHFFPKGDHDWVRFEALRGVTYRIETANLATESDTVLKLFHSDGSTLLAYDDDGGEGLASRIIWQCPAEGTYCVQVSHYSESVSGPDTAYDLLVQRDEARPEIKELVTRVTIALPEPLAGQTHSWCTWTGCNIGPRLYHEPLLDGRTMIGWTDASGDGHVSIVSGSAIERTFEFERRAVKGLVAHDDGGFAVLLWDEDARTMWLSRRSYQGGEIWSTDLNSDIARADFWLGGGRLSFGGGLYAAYFTVKGTSGGFAGHHGDQLTYVDANGNIQPDGSDWGCSHSMAQLVDYHPDLQKFIPVCSSDCFPGKGIFLFANGDYEVYGGDGNCAGLVSAQLGQVARGEGNWKVVFNALDRSCCRGHGVGLATVSADYQAIYVWLTHTDGAHERDPVIARLGAQGQPERHLVGWMTQNDGVYWLGVIDNEGQFIAGPEEVSSAGVRWGNRDDSLRTRPDRTVSWVRGEPNGDTLDLYRFNGSGYVQ